MYGDNTNDCGIHIINIPKNVHLPKVKNLFQSKLSYPDVSKGCFLHTSFEKAVFCTHKWDASARNGIIGYTPAKHKKRLALLTIGSTITSCIRANSIDIVTSYWDIYALEIIRRYISG